LYEFYNQLKPEDKNKPWEFGIILKKIATGIFETLPYNDILWMVEKEKYFGNPLVTGLWDRFLETEREYLEQTEFIPMFFESDFGYLKKKGNKNSYSPPLVIKKNDKKIKIYGKIDRIDIDDRGRYSVIDYKSGQSAMKIKISDMLDGWSLQLPVYIAAARQLLQDKIENVVPAAGAYYQVQDANNCRIKFVLINQKSGAGLPGSKNEKNITLEDGQNGSEITFDEVIEKSLDHIITYIENMNRGNFKHTSSPKDPKCTSYCSFYRICRKDTGKLLSFQE
jgi:ATP-dependent helicase/DNAse subunit B